VKANGHSRAEIAQVADRRTRLVEYRRQKRPYIEIYEELGYKTVSAATKDFSRALAENLASQDTSVELYREEQIQELDYLAEEAHKILRGEYFVVANNGHIVEHPQTGAPLQDMGPKLAAVDRIVRISDRIAKLRGLDAPTRVEGALSIDALNRAINEAKEQLASLGGEADEAPGTAPADG
jgi:hypothetical protein